MSPVLESIAQGLIGLVVLAIAAFVLWSQTSTHYVVFDLANGIEMTIQVDSEEQAIEASNAIAEVMGRR